MGARPGHSDYRGTYSYVGSGPLIPIKGGRIGPKSQVVPKSGSQIEPSGFKIARFKGASQRVSQP
jgi:hypothetical protein